MLKSQMVILSSCTKIEDWAVTLQLLHKSAEQSMNYSYLYIYLSYTFSRKEPFKCENKLFLYTCEIANPGFSIGFCL